MTLVRSDFFYACARNPAQDPAETPTLERADHVIVQAINSHAAASQ
jgi:hypothetical protein